MNTQSDEEKNRKPTDNQNPNLSPSAPDEVVPGSNDNFVDDREYPHNDRYAFTNQERGAGKG
jgi:hypothetical protein